MFPNSEQTTTAAHDDVDAAALVHLANQKLYKDTLELLVRITGGLFQAAQQTLASWRPESVPAVGDPLNAALNYHAYNLSMHEAFVQNLANDLAQAAPKRSGAGLERINVK